MICEDTDFDLRRLAGACYRDCTVLLQIYYVSRGKVKLSKKAFAGLSKYEVLLSAETEVELVSHVLV